MLFPAVSGDVFGHDGQVVRNGAIAISVILAINCIWTFYKTRVFYKNLPGPPHSWLFGHLPALLKASKRFPPDVHPQLILNSLVDEYSLRDSGVMYLDTFPVRSDNQMVITQGALCAQVASFHVMRKSPALKNTFGRVIGLKAISITDGAQWRKFRTIFNPGFAASNIMSLMPAMLDEGEIFVSHLSAIASAGGPRGGYTPSIMKLLKDLTADIIIRLTVGTSTECQKAPNELVDMICTASRWPQPASINPLKKFDFRVNLALRYYDWRCKRIIRKMVLERWEKVKSGELQAIRLSRSKVILDLALHDYMTTMLEAGRSVEGLDPEFLDVLCDNIKGFVFGGQDTTANSASWILYNLFQKPDIVAEVRREHNRIFGSDPNAINNVLRARPHLINQVPWTAAVIKESMRIFAPASSIRAADDSMEITNPTTGRIYPTANQLIFLPSHILQRDAMAFPKPREFLPSRFMPNNPDTQNIDPNAYRPFERGPRGCIGQDLAMVELKLILCLVVRKFSFENAYEELNRRRGTVPVSVDGEGGWAYPVLYTTSQPKDGMPMWIREESNVKETKL